ncbi:MAG TPA: hypothetical protein VD790_04025 [Thermoleophilaceae bacterium]|nr:hypothetical protein [Thermoleophilaceae bacterium]
MHWPLPLHLGTDVPKDLGDPLPQAWQIAWGGHALQHQPLDYWQSNMYWPLDNTLAFSDALVGYAPFGLIGEGFEAAIVRYNLLFLFAYALAAFGAYLLAREVGVGRGGAAVGAIAFAYAPWRLEQDGHMHVISSGGIPLALFLLVRGYRRRSPGVVIAGWLVAAWQLALGFTLGLMLAYLLAVLAVVVLVSWWRKRPSRGLVAASVAGAAVFAAVGVLLAMPYQEVRDDHPESERTAETVAAFSGGPEMFLAAPDQSTIWGPVTRPVRDGLDFIPEQTLFPGVLVLLLAIFGLSRASPLSTGLRIGLGVGVLLLVVLSLGFQLDSGVPYPYRALYDYAPGWDAVRTPGRLNTLTSLGLALLAAAGAHALIRRAHPPAVLAIGLPLIVLVEGAGFPNPHPTVAQPPAGLEQAAAPRLHLPMDVYESRRFLLWSTDGFPEILNGRASFKPTFFARLERGMAAFPADWTLDYLRDLGVETVVLHPDLVPGTEWEDWRTWPVQGTSTGGVVLYRLNTAP